MARPGYQSWETKRNIADVRDSNIAAKQADSQAKLMSAQADLNASVPPPGGLAPPSAATGVDSPDRMERMKALQGMIPMEGDGIKGVSPGLSSSIAPSTPGLPPIGGDLGGGFGATSPYSPWEGSVKTYADGGPVYGPEGLDQVPAEMPDGSPARLNNGEYVLPAEYVVGLAKKSLGKKAEMLPMEKLHALGVDLLDAEIAGMTGKAPGAEPSAPLPGQGADETVPGMAAGQGLRLDPLKQQERARQLEARQTGNTPIGRLEQAFVPERVREELAWKEQQLPEQRATPSVRNLPNLVSNVMAGRSVSSMPIASEGSPPTQQAMSPPRAGAMAGRNRSGPGDNITDTGITGKGLDGTTKKVYKNTFSPGSAQEQEFGKAIYSDSRRGATQQGFNADIRRYGQGVDGATFQEGGKGLNYADVNPQQLAMMTQSGRDARPGQLQQNERAALQQWSQQPQISDIKQTNDAVRYQGGGVGSFANPVGKFGGTPGDMGGRGITKPTAARGGHNVTSFTSKAPLPDWGKDMMGMPNPINDQRVAAQQAQQAHQRGLETEAVKAYRAPQPIDHRQNIFYGEKIDPTTQQVFKVPYYMGFDEYNRPVPIPLTGQGGNMGATSALAFDPNKR